MEITHERSGDGEDAEGCAVQWCTRPALDSEYCWRCQRKYGGSGVIY